MATKGRKSTNKSVKASASVTADPFESTVEAAIPKPARKAVAARPSKPAPSVSNPAPKKKAAAKTVEPFAELALEPKAVEPFIELPSEPKPRPKKTLRGKKAVTVPASPVKRGQGKASTPTAVKAVEEEMSPVFKALADVKLPELTAGARARLLVQSPTRLFLYWSLRQDPWAQLRAAFGEDLGNYTLVLKLRNLTTEAEEMYPAERQGEWWFNSVIADCEYVAEIGFYAVARPYFRVLYSNTVSTPRSSPSPHPASEARWTVSATKFAEVLDASGFTRDAIDVAIAGDDHTDAEERTRAAFAEFTGSTSLTVSRFAAEDLRHALIAAASGASLEDLRGELSPELFDLVQVGSGDAASARKALAAHFDVEEEEWSEHQYGPAVFGASSIHFPKALKPRKALKYEPRYNPVSSFRLGR